MTHSFAFNVIERAVVKQWKAVSDPMPQAQNGIGLRLTPYKEALSELHAYFSRVKIFAANQLLSQWLYTCTGYGVGLMFRLKAVIFEHEQIWTSIQFHSINVLGGEKCLYNWVRVRKGGCVLVTDHFWKLKVNCTKWSTLPQKLPLDRKFKF